MEIEIINWSFQWDIGASNLEIFHNYDKEEFKISYRIAAVDSKIKNEFVTVLFTNCQAFKFQKMRYDLNALKRHKYFNLGLMHNDAHKLKSSDWVNEFKLINPDDINRKLNHYILSFKDELIEI